MPKVKSQENYTSKAEKFGNQQDEMTPPTKSSEAKQSSQIKMNNNNIIRFKNREYQFFGNGIISDEQAMEIYEKLLQEQKDPN